ncbi:MAG: lipid A deacylase LpxR family protein [Proteobacteria bacterium]|nr:lipid A deacylase LpxR family protein [Pseudomonadota bacterium]
MSVQYENDFFARSGDRYYTHGSQISRLVLGDNPEWLKSMASPFSFLQSDGILNATNYTIGQKIFTPDDTVSATLLVDERPYAGYYFVNAALLSRINRNHLYDTGNLLEFSLGVVGPLSMAEEMQTVFHNSLNIDKPNGWDNQLHNELGLGLTYSRLWRFVVPMSESLDFGVNPQTTITVGNVYTYAATGAMFRLGTRLRNDLGPPSVRPGFPGIPSFQIENGFRWYLFAGGEARLMGRNIFLDGNTFRDSHSVEKETWVADYQYGLVLHGGHVRISLSNIYRTKEYTTQKDEAHYGALNISFAIR